MILPQGQRGKIQVERSAINVDKIEELVTSLKTEVSQKLKDYESIIDIRMQHFDSMIEQLRQDQKDSQESTIKAIERIIELNNQNLMTIIKHQDERIDTVKCTVDEHEETFDKRLIEAQASVGRLSERVGRGEKKIDEVAIVLPELKASVESHETRIEKLEKKPIEQDAEKWNRVRDKVLWAFIGLLTAGGVAGATQLIEYLKGSKV